MRSLLISLLLVACIVPGYVLGQGFPYKFSYLTVDEGLSHTDVNDLAQDRKGYIWVGTNFGLDRYDGYSVQQFYNTNVPLQNAFKNRIIALHPDGEDKIWLSTENGVQCFDPASERYIDYTIRKTSKNPVFWKFFKPTGNLIYGLTGNEIRLYRIVGTTLEELPLNIPAGIRFFDMQPDRSGILHFASDRGLWRLEGKWQFVKVPVSGLPSENLRRIFFDNRNNLLIASGNQVLLAGGGELPFVKKRFTCAECTPIVGVTAGNGPDYWVNTRTGLIRLDGNLNLIQKIDEVSAPRSLNSTAVVRVYIDRSDCLWVGTSGGGLNYFDLNQKLFYTMRHDPGQANSLTGSYVRSIYEDGSDLWIGTNADGLDFYDRKSGAHTNYNAVNSAVRLRNDNVAALAFDPAHNLWIGTESGIDILRPDKKTIWKPDGHEQFPTFGITTLVADYYGNIWYGNLEKLGVIWKDAAGKYNVREYAEGHFILAEKDKPELFIATRQGVKRITVDAQGRVLRTISYRATSQPHSLSSDYSAVIGRQNDSTYWIGTIGGGLHRLSLRERDRSTRIEHFGENHGIFNDVEGIEIDGDNIWLGGNGLLCLNSKTGKLIRYDKNDGLQGNSFKIRSSFKAADGKMYFGGINGLNYFYPQQIRPNTIAAKPVFTGILINNRRPKIDGSADTDDVVSQAIGYGENVQLNYQQNNFIVSFSAMHFANPLKCRYRYKLIGFDNDWNYTDGNNPRAGYSNLSYGNYRLVLEATNNDGIWSRRRAEISINISPPWWKTDLAKALYALLAISALAGIYFYQARWHRLKREIEVRGVAEQEREEIHRQREEFYQQQLMFFTNVSHEFRTPLSLILGPLESLISQNNDATLGHSYQLMHRNAKRLINLISELMNFKKVSDSLIKLQVRPLAISEFCKQLTTEFDGVAASKNIVLNLIDHTQKKTHWPLMGLFDAQILEKILLNLLNNSFKYTQDGGEVTFEIFTDLSRFKRSFETGFELLHEAHRARKYLYFRVADTGIGISADTITRIFDRYYRISSDHLGSGVGLALVKSLTHLHKGDIYVYSERYKGTEIIIGIPLGEENWAEAERAPSTFEPEVRLEPTDHSILAPITDPVSGRQEGVQSGKRILLVDDNAELRIFLKQRFEQQYFIYEAADGDTAMKLAAEKVPDLIISDVMMPGISGIELCRQIKERFETSHIPFIILSAKDALTSKIEGMESGADFYFSKPLSIDLLMLTVNNVFEQREKLRKKFTNNYLSEASELVHSEKDKEFFQTLLKLIEDHMEDPNLDVDFLCRHLYTSRTKLYQKIKSITDQSVGDFVRTIRLKKAIQIMTHEDIPLNKVVDRVGLQSSSNFSRVFKKEYGKSPLQFMQALKREGSGGPVSDRE